MNSYRVTSVLLVVHLCSCVFSVESSASAPLIRLVDGTDACEGRIEIRLHTGGEWGTVCDDLWRVSNADVACRELGYGPAMSPILRRSFGKGVGPILMDDVVCRGREKTLRACRYSAKHNCAHKEDVGVRCSGCVPGSEQKPVEEIVHGAWSKWSTWSQCTVTCGGGRKMRERGCDNPAPQNGGNLCVGKSIQSRKCGKRRCEKNWSRWTEWSPCSVTCGNGTRERYRHCMTRPARCRGADTARQTCEMQRCSDSVCSTAPCKNGGTCLPCATCDGGYYCHCKLGHYGKKCEDQCGCRKAGIRAHIVMSPGTRESGAWPWNALLKVPSKSSYLCSATLIHPEWLLTTAHCVRDAFPGRKVVSPAEFKPVFDLEDRCRDPQTTTSNIREIIVHPKFRSDPSLHRYDYDVALLRLRTPMTEQTPACLPKTSCEETSVNNQTKCFVIGWGKTSETSFRASCQLLRVNLPIERSGKCNSSRYHNGSISERMFCAGRRGKDSCQGDSGSQFACPTPDGRTCSNGKEAFEICGMVSWGVGCGRLHKPGVYTNVYAFVPWITNEIESRKPVEKKGGDSKRVK